MKTFIQNVVYPQRTKFKIHKYKSSILYVFGEILLLYFLDFRIPALRQPLVFIHFCMDWKSRSQFLKPVRNKWEKITWWIRLYGRISAAPCFWSASLGKLWHWIIKCDAAAFAPWCISRIKHETLKKLQRKLETGHRINKLWRLLHKQTE